MATKHYWIIGHPLTFCLSTPVMNRLFKEIGVDAQFETHDVAPEGLDDVMQKLKSGELDGLVTTMPHKTPAMHFLDELSPEVKTIEAVNLILRENGKLHGYNTDWTGALGALESVFPDLKGMHIHVLGAGGAARAAAYAFLQKGAQVSMWNRSPDRAKAFAEKMGITWVEDMRKWDGTPQVIVNATSMSYQSKQSTMVPFPLWEKVELALDAVYGKTSLFLEEAKAMNVKNVLSGEVWYKHQAVPMFEFLTGGKTVSLDLVENYAKENLLPEKAEDAVTF